MKRFSRRKQHRFQVPDPLVTMIDRIVETQLPDLGPVHKNPWQLTAGKRRLRECIVEHFLGWAMREYFWAQADGYRGEWHEFEKDFRGRRSNEAEAEQINSIRGRRSQYDLPGWADVFPNGLKTEAGADLELTPADIELLGSLGVDGCDDKQP